MSHVVLVIFASCGSQNDPGCEHGFAIPLVLIVIAIAAYLWWDRRIKRWGRSKRDDDPEESSRRYIYGFDDDPPKTDDGTEDKKPPGS
jgi:hypothetical protein